MSFIYCDPCDWQQDDFWSWSYNPLRSILRILRDYCRPRMMRFDREAFGKPRIFSWEAGLRLIGRQIRKIPRQRWWTYQGWKKAGYPKCPTCGESYGQD